MIYAGRAGIKGTELQLQMAIWWASDSGHFRHLIDGH